MTHPQLNTIIISIGSNKNSESNIEYCRKALSKLFDFIIFSSTSVTKPFGVQYKNDFLNQLALARTGRALTEIKSMVKRIEKEMGRTIEDEEQGLVEIDIDIVKWNNEVLKEKDWQRNYVIDLLPSLYEHLDAE